MSSPKKSSGWPKASRQPPTGRSSLLGTVLVIDDVPYMLELASVFLSRTARVLTASGGAEGLEIARRHRPDLIVSDSQMPGLSGVELCRAAAADPRLCSTPVIILVNGASGRERGLAIRAGATDVLVKPLSRLSLIEAVSRQLSGARLRALPRVPLEIRARVTASTREETGVVRNVSRGGLFLETSCDLAQRSEVDLRFRLPGSPHLLAASAQVIWRKPEVPGRPSGSEGAGSAHGFGLRFLDIDRTGIRSLDDFVYERAAPRSSTFPTATS